MAFRFFGRHLHNQIIIPLLIAAVCVALIATLVGVYQLSHIVDRWVGGSAEQASAQARAQLEESAARLQMDSKFVIEDDEVIEALAAHDAAATGRALVHIRKTLDVDDIIVLEQDGALFASSGRLPLRALRRPLPDDALRYSRIDMQFETFLNVGGQDLLAAIRSQSFGHEHGGHAYTIVLTRWITSEYLGRDFRGKASAVALCDSATGAKAFYVDPVGSSGGVADSPAVAAVTSVLSKGSREIEQAIADPGHTYTLETGGQRYAVRAEKVSFSPQDRSAGTVTDPTGAERCLLVLVNASLAGETGNTTVALIAFWSLVAVAVLTGLGAVIARRVSGPLTTLSENARRVADGDFAARVDIGGNNELAELGESFNVMTESLKDRTEALTKKVLELATLYEMSRALGSTLDLDVLLESVLDSALRIFDVDSGYVMLRDKATAALDLRAWRGMKPERPDEGSVRSSMSEWVVRQGRPLVFNPSQDEPAEQHVDAVTGALAALCVPLVSSEGVVGAICVGSRDRDYRFSSDDVRLLSTIANHVTIAIGNIELFSSLQDAYLATVRALAAAVDAKDPFTRGHSDRVASYARAIAEKLELSGEQSTALEMAAYLHDIGKIGVREGILLKPGKLSDEEYGQMKHHPLIGANILRPVAFPWPIAPVVRHHHEHYDGKGYPAGLKGEEIPLLARILTVADAFEAMTSDRPYRPGRTDAEAIEELRRCQGSHFDPRVVDSFIAALAEESGLVGTVDGSKTERVEPEEARAIFVAVCDGMFASFRRLGGPRLASNLEATLDDHLLSAGLPFQLRNGRMTADWDSAGTLDRQMSEMRQVVRHMARCMEAAAGGSLVDNFYVEALSTLSERMRRLAEVLDLYSKD